MIIKKRLYILMTIDVLLTALASYLTLSLAFKYYFAFHADLTILEQWMEVFYLFIFSLGPVLLFSYTAPFPLLKTKTAVKTYLGKESYLTFLGLFGIQSILSFGLAFTLYLGHTRFGTAYGITNIPWKDDFLVFYLIFECIKLVFLTLGHLIYFFIEERFFPAPDIPKEIRDQWEEEQALVENTRKREIQKQKRLKERAKNRKTGK